MSQTICVDFLHTSASRRAAKRCGNTSNLQIGLEGISQAQMCEILPPSQVCDSGFLLPPVQDVSTYVLCIYIYVVFLYTYILL